MKTLLCYILFLIVLIQATAFDYEDPADYPLMGDWQGTWIEAARGHEKAHPQMAAQLLPVRGDRYRVVILPELYNRAKPYLHVEVPASHQRVEVKRDGWDVVFEGREAKGRAMLNGELTSFVLKKVPLNSPTLGLEPPPGATVLFDGTDFDAWQHPGGKAVTWERVGEAMQVITRNDKSHREQGLGGNIETKAKFGSMRFHMEFRYPVEAEHYGQLRGNSGLFFSGIGEIQILNSYTTPNYWNECGAIYKRVPAKVDAAGPPLEWQSYDVDLELPETPGGKAILTVYLNGRILHNRMELPAQEKRVRILLQDHTNPLQFRNIWLVEQ